LDALAENGQDTDGFLYRFLFEFGEKDDASKWEDKKKGKMLVLEAYSRYAEIINRISDIPFSGETTILNTCVGADVIFGEYHDKNEERLAVNRKMTANKGVENSIIGKMSMYSTKFALIAEVISWACGESDLSCISEESMRKGVELAQYYENNSMRALMVIQKNKEEKEDIKPRSSSSCNWGELFQGKNEATTKELTDRILIKYGKSDRTARRWITGELTALGHGVWTYMEINEK
jgi:hypothetical protein